MFETIKGRLLGRLLEEVVRKGGYIPDAAWPHFHQLTVLPYPEVAIVRERDGKWELLLTHREDEHWDGWHIPGGLWRVRDGEDFPTICGKIAQRELNVPADQVRFVRVVMVHVWTDHPYGHPLSVVCLCRTDREIEETETMQFFSIRNLPPMVNHHWKFCLGVFRDLEEKGL